MAFGVLLYEVPHYFFNLISEFQPEDTGEEFTYQPQKR
jgi:hypothetical protein